MSAKKPFVLTPFCFRQFIKSPGTVTINMTMQDFMSKLNDLWVNGDYELKPGYAPFCKHVFVPNFTDSCVAHESITDQNRHMIETDYYSRNSKELPVLRRYFKREKINPTKAKFLDIILYSRKQIELEEQAISYKDVEEEHGLKQAKDYDWGVVSIKPQNVEHELPMDPITMMRNALGTQEGGSGVALNREKYLESVEYWSKHVLIV